MAYSPIVNFAAKDALAHLDAAKLIKGTEISAELVAIAADLALKATATDLDTAEATLAAIVGGTYTPTLTNTTNIDSSTPAMGFYQRIGSVVSVVVSISINTTGAGSAVLGVSLPVASNIGAATDVAGMGAADFDTHETISGLITGNSANDRATYTFGAADGAAYTHILRFSYRIL